MPTLPHPALRFLKCLCALAFAGGSLCAAEAAVATLSIGHEDSPGAVKLVLGKAIADIYVDAKDAKVVTIAAGLLADDIERVTGTRPRVVNDPAQLGADAVIVGSLGHSALIDQLAAAGKIDAKGVSGQWETYRLQVVGRPLPNVERALVILGSDRRGAAFGVFTLSEDIGVSPWYWWADVPTKHQDALVVGPQSLQAGPPSVKYRGIFLNDEDWGLQPWAAKTFEPETGDIGPKTYAKVCELLLRLKGNYLWPAMHEVTKAFNAIPQNKVVADEYGIVMGSHAEQMLFNNASEWHLPANDWNYTTNAAGIRAVWEKRVSENGLYENAYTLGIRGIHDSPMIGGGTTADKVAVLQQVIADQRDMLARLVNPKIEQVAQLFVPYKEVLPLYQNGLKLPEDVSLVWPDDNYGYIRQLSNAEEQKRSGGSGVYYHVSYYGTPAEYLWIDTTPPALIWEEMDKAYDNGAKDFWILNVGDLKPAEPSIDFFLRMAWDLKPWKENAQPVFLAQWAARTFGDGPAAEIAAIMGEYYRLNQSVKPEHLLKTGFATAYGEVALRLKQFGELLARTDAVEAKLSAEQRDAFFELVAYPVRGSAQLNEMWLTADPAAAQRAYEQIQSETRHYNQEIGAGKWLNIMSASPRNQPVFRPRRFAALPAAQPAGDETLAADAGVSIEAEHPTRKTDGATAAWKVIAGLGRTGDSIALLPTNAAIGEAAALEYDFTSPKAGAANVLVYCLPTHALTPTANLRYAVSVDGGPAQVVDVDSKEFAAQWSTNVVRNIVVGGTKFDLTGPGKHTLKLRPLDAGLVFEKIVIDFGGVKPTQLGPPETAVTASR